MFGHLTIRILLISSTSLPSRRLSIGSPRTYMASWRVNAKYVISKQILLAHVELKIWIIIFSSLRPWCVTIGATYMVTQLDDLSHLYWELCIDHLFPTSWEQRNILQLCTWSNLAVHCVQSVKQCASPARAPVVKVDLGESLWRSRQVQPVQVQALCNLD